MFIEVTEMDGTKMTLNTEYIKGYHPNPGARNQTIIVGFDLHFNCGQIIIQEDYKSFSNRICAAK